MRVNLQKKRKKYRFFVLEVFIKVGHSLYPTMRSKRRTKCVNPSHWGCLSLMYLYVTKVDMNSSMDRPAVEPGVILPSVRIGILFPPLGVPPILRGRKWKWCNPENAAH